MDSFSTLNKNDDVRLHNEKYCFVECDNVLFRKKLKTLQNVVLPPFSRSLFHVEDVRSMFLRKSANLYQTAWHHFPENSIPHYTSLLKHLCLLYSKRGVGT
jgi:hypothetical protein